MEAAMAAASAEAVQTPTSADDSRIPSSKIFLVPKTGDQLETSSHGGGATSIPLSPLRQVIRNVLLPTNQNSARDYIMKPRDESPDLSSSDVLMTSFNVLEDGDPVHRYQLQEEGVPTEHQHTEYPSGPVTSASWTDRGLEHNSNSILRALREPQDRQQPSWKAMTMQAMYSTSDRQRPIDTVVTSQGVVRWNDYNQNKEHVYQEYSVHDMSRESMATQQKLSERLPQPQPTPSPEGTLTRAVKETFCIAHFSCTHCNEKFRVPEKLAEHVKTVHSGSIVYTCFTCGQKFYNSFDLREHVASHANDPIKCSLCDLTLSSSKELRNHHKKCHPMSVISCLLCEKIFATVSARTKHLVVEHQNDNRLKVCDLCGDAFVDKAAYEEHLKNHPKTTAENLASAVKRQPDVSEPPATVIIWKCDKCGIIFPDDKALGTHKDTEHQDDFTKPPVAQHLRNVSQERLQLKQTPTDSRYELLRLLLARRMAASSKTVPTTSAPHVQTSTVTDVSNIANVLSSDIPMTSRGEGGQLNRPSVQEAPSHGRGPGILSAETMQHVADELSMLEQSMDNKRKQVDQFLTMRNLPMTADMMMDSESTIGINYALKKNSTQDMKFKEIHKQKTLVNMLQGTVASIIEKEVKYNKTSSKIQYHMPTEASQQKDSKHSDNASYSLADYDARNVHVKQNEKQMENNNMIYENRNLGTGHPSQNQSGILHRTSANMLPPLDLQKTYPYVTTSAGTFPQSSVLSTMPTMHSERDSYELQQKEGSNKYNNKCTSPWDNHIAPLLKLFQNVSSPPSDKVSPEDPFQKQKADDPNSQYLFPKESILDLSSSQPNTFDVNHPLTLTSGYSQHLSEVSKSADFPRNVNSSPRSQEIRTTSGNIIHGTNIQVKPNTPLPAFRDISWSRNKSSKNNPVDIPVSIVDSVYASLTSLSQPHSDVNQMSGGQLHYAQSEEDAYYGQSGERYDSRLGAVQSSPTMMQTGNPDDLQQQQTFNYQGNQHHQQQLSPQEEFVHRTQQSPHENPQTYQHSSFLSEEQAHLGQNSQHLAEHQGTTYATSPTGQLMGNSYATMTPVQLPSLMQDQQQMNEVHHHNHHHHQNYSPLSQQSPSPQKQMQLQHQNYNSPPEYNKSEVSQQNDKLRPVNDTVTRAITEYLNNRNTFLAKRSIPEVPLVVRHKLLATMLNEGSGAEGSEGIQNNMSAEEIGKQFQLDATRVNGAHRHNHMGHPQSQMHSVMSPSSEREEASYAGLIASTNNVLYETPIHETNAYGSSVINRSLSEPTPSTEMSMDRQMQRPLSQSDTSTIDSQLLNQMMLSEVPTSHVTLPQMPPPRKQSKLHWSLPPQGTTHYTEGPSGHHINYIPSHVSPHMNPAAIPVTVEEGYNDYMMAPHSFPLPNKNEKTGTKQSRRRQMGPAIRKRKAFVITQRVDDEYIMVDGCVNVTAPKRARTCTQLGCHIPSSPSAQPSQPRMRGRPPKNGSLTVRKGSYKKGKYPCPVCGKFYAWKNYLRIHIAKHDKNMVEKVDDGQEHGT